MPRQRWLTGPLLAFLLAHISLADDVSQIPDVLGEEIGRFRELMSSPLPAYRIEGAQGAYHLKLQVFEPKLIGLLKDEDPMVKQEAVLALSRCGTWRSVIHLMALLDDPNWQVREHAHLALCQMTGERFEASPRGEWQSRVSREWNASSMEEKQARLFAALEDNDPAVRLSAARAMRCMATPAAEDRLLKLLTESGGIGEKERSFLTEALDRIGTSKSMPYFLERASMGDAAAAWALGSRGGKEAEEALVKGLGRNFGLDFMLNLDRLHSTQCGPFLRRLCAGFGSLILGGFRSEDMRYPPRPQHRAAANLIRRSGKGQMLVDLVLAEMEGKTDPAERGTAIPADLKPLFQDMQQILKPGFIREGFGDCACLLSAFYYVADDKAIAPRLIPLLKSECTIVRIYAALTLGKLRAAEAVGPMLEVIRGGYPFSDSTASASGKHTGTFRLVDGKNERQSQTVRWLGYFCIALGNIGSDEARKSLEALAADPKSPRDVRYGSVVGLGFIRSPESLPVLRKVADGDIIWMIRNTARQHIADIELASSARPAQAGSAQTY